MNIHILTLFPEVFESVFTKSIVKRALEKNLLKISLVNIRKWGEGKHKKVDDTPYGGGPGMVLMVKPVHEAINSINPKPYIILLSASGKKFNQKKAGELAKKKNLAIICGHYEGVDARVEKYIDEEISIGDFVLTGGEIPAMAIVDSITRLLPGVISKESPLKESFSENLLEYPQFTKPESYKNLKVPKVLLSGNHQEIADWRQVQAKKKTKTNRPDLLK